MLATVTRNLIHASAAGCVLLLTAAAPVAAQKALDRPVIVALPDTFPASGRPDADALALVYRFGGPRGQADIIVLNPAHATPQALRLAVLLLRRFRESGALDAGHRLVIPVESEVPPAPPAARRFGAALAQLRGRPHGGVQGLGAARWLRFAHVEQLGP